LNSINIFHELRLVFHENNFMNWERYIKNKLFIKMGTGALGRLVKPNPRTLY
jgi:hypothetical protein